ncbi:hypothetical protein C5467_21865 [Photorhabdus khanii subsp. guanajuatensis]|uniref:Uncharacterized protein n=1 Tax=Photorhabdus khanii subsp. guanajuatensis TaxID=2100166 RepID=A0A4R4IWS3_9GAMM|nr:hypothetical protein C5467_21865 [Photorhabdus khanii subsp. guanajuatensis]
MKAYIVKVALRGVSPMVWHRFRLLGETSLSDKHSQLPDCALLRTERATFTALRSSLSKAFIVTRQNFS